MKSYIFVSTLLFTIQIPEQFGPIRTVAEGKGNVILIGTTRNFVLQGTLSGDFTPITQVLSAWQMPNSYILPLMQTYVSIGRAAGSGVSQWDDFLLQRCVLCRD